MLSIDDLKFKLSKDNTEKNSRPIYIMTVAIWVLTIITLIPFVAVIVTGTTGLAKILGLAIFPVLLVISIGLYFLLSKVDS